MNQYEPVHSGLCSGRQDDRLGHELVARTGHHLAWFRIRYMHVPGSVQGGAHARALIAAGWFGIYCWIGTMAIDGLMQVAFEGWRTVPGHTAMDFLFFWGLNMLIAYKGPEIIKNLMRISAPLLMIAVLGLFAWALVAAGG